jgi:nitrate reductase gamma subunit
MKLERFLTIAAVIAIAFGLAFFISPARVLTEYGISGDTAVVIMARFFGATLLNIGFVLFLARRASEPAIRLGIVRGSLIGSVFGLIVAIHGQRIGAVNSLGWSSVAIYGLLTLGYAYFAFGDQESSASPVLDNGRTM